MSTLRPGRMAASAHKLGFLAGSPGRVREAMDDGKRCSTPPAATRRPPVEDEGTVALFLHPEVIVLPGSGHSPAGALSGIDCTKTSGGAPGFASASPALQGGARFGEQRDRVNGGQPLLSGRRASVGCGALHLFQRGGVARNTRRDSLPEIAGSNPAPASTPAASSRTPARPASTAGQGFGPVRQRRRCCGRAMSSRT